uniref:BAG domain-containing protein n=1 Tax=Aplanochytrium stocchinoi TaxID=215587 RepID=A0A7S3PNB9_9STRA|mmetsp:Transcript_409/g.477  ORF Transcript_409/g.477 Transcript_409/m.477 type:complete len:359 (+) Transcript_409:549-1625(+)|eukprot:CAMPEP_0204826376 /NCGR_PEP_ID=MMETSP1346-20131115/4070_1 /ASSEMBLY_ACC=CAM_ASM_000771 /TAXON_ID=215587 /ORGANISM="Aplanochytrium stocchinoi, Strain GSBS06" /LENGTH=358 /DNA_ID=CAMNT_0051954365 /DNA_START=452 /DNA_END=1528 /DNA_ORIENTATION=+
MGTKNETEKDEASGDLSISNSDSSTVEESLEKLKAISQKVDKIALRLETLNSARPFLSAKLAAYKWYSNTFHSKELSSYDVLASSKHRTLAAGCVEALMVHLEELDQIQSEGHDNIRRERRKLVLKITNQFLPLADKTTYKGKKLLALTEKVMSYITKRKRSNSNADIKTSEKDSDIEMRLDTDTGGPAQEKHETKAREMETDSDSDSGSDDGNSNKNPDISEAENKIKRKDEPDSSKDSNKQSAENEPNYRISESGDEVKISISIPASESVDQIKFKMEDGGSTLAVYGSNFCLPFAVNQHRYSVKDSTYKYISTKHILEIVIPKRKQHGNIPIVGEPKYSPFTGRRNPSVWGWPNL